MRITQENQTDSTTEIYQQCSGAIKQMLDELIDRKIIEINSFCDNMQSILRGK